MSETSRHVKIRNHIPDPRPLTMDNWQRNNSNIEFRFTANKTGFYLRALDDAEDKYIRTRLSSVPAGDYVYCATVGDFQGMSPRMILRVIGLNPIREIANAPWTGNKETQHTVSFHLDASEDIELRLMCPKPRDLAAAYRQFGLFTREDFTIMQSLQVQWFSGNDILRGGGGIS